MSAYGVNFDCYIRGKKETIKKIADISQTVFDANKDSHYEASYYESINRRIQREYQRVNQESNTICVIFLSFSSDDCSQGVFGDFMTAFQEGAEEIEFAVKASQPIDYADYDPVENCYEEPFQLVTTYVYKAPDSDAEKIDFGNSQDRYSESEAFGESYRFIYKFPVDADWIPSDWIASANDPFLTDKERLENFFRATPCIRFGNYKGYPIEWLVVKEGDVLTLVSKYGLDKKPYHEKLEYTTWENSSLRMWLNHTFMDHAFTKEEQNAIVTTRLKNDCFAGFYDEEAPTEDKVFLLSPLEWREFFEKDPGNLYLTYGDVNKEDPVPCSACYQLEDRMMEDCEEQICWLRTHELADTWHRAGSDMIISDPSELEEDEGSDLITSEYTIRPVLRLDWNKAGLEKTW